MPVYDNQVDLHVKQGEDYTAQVFWVDDYGTPVPVTSPGRMEVRSNDEQRQLLALCEDTAPDPGDTVRGYLALNDVSGVIDIFIPATVTAGMPTGSHVYDLFVHYRRTLDSDDPANQPLWGDDHIRSVISGMCHVRPRVTQIIPRGKEAIS